MEGGAPGLAVGDVLLRAGDRDLRGVGTTGLTPALWAVLDGDLRTPLTWRGSAGETTGELALSRARFPLRTLPLTVLTGAIALLVLLRGRGSSSARAYFLASMAHSLQWSSFFGRDPVAVAALARRW